jgi:hypothetical protein
MPLGAPAAHRSPRASSRPWRPGGRRAHQGALDDRAALQGAIQLYSLESLHPRPETDVHRRRILRLQRAHPVEDLRQRRRDALQQHLACEQGPVELPLGQYPASRHLGRAVWLSGGLLAAGLRQNDAARSPHRVEALPPIVLGTSTRMQPAGVDGLLEPVATMTPAIAATSSSPTATVTILRSRPVVSRRGVLTRCQWPSRGTKPV